MLKEIWKERQQLVEKQLVKELEKEPPLDARLAESMRYSLMAGGKRLRPILLMAAADAVGAKGTDYLTTACALEMIHTYSLIHDDLPAMDNDDYRRGKLTNHKVYGDGMAVLAGDALLTLAFEVIARQQHTDPATLLRVVQEISTAAGMNGMVGGQAIDLESVGRQLDQQALETMHRHKTGALIEASVQLGALASGNADEPALRSLQHYAQAIGLAFQVQDDILDVESDTATLGKTQGKDEANHKPTYPALLGMEAAKAYALELRDQALHALRPFGDSAEPLRELARYIVERRS